MNDPISPEAVIKHQKVIAGKAFLLARAEFLKAEAKWKRAKADAIRVLSIDEQNALIDMANRKQEAKQQAERDAANKALLKKMGW
jgi:hypothetical protein